MEEKKHSSGNRISNAIGSERQSAASSDLSRLNGTLVKSPLWKKNTLRGIEILRAANSSATSPETSGSPEETDGEPAALALHNEEISAIRRELQAQSTVLEERAGEIERLRQSVANLEAENTRLKEQHQAELDARSVELSDLQAAYDQFEQQSDELLNELDKQNERLKAECKRQNRFSVL